MPIVDNPDRNHPMRFIARYYDGQNKRRSILCLDRLAAEREIALNSGPKSAAELPKLSCSTVVEVFINEQRKRKIVDVGKLHTILQQTFVRRWGDLPFGELTEDHFIELQDELMSRPLRDLPPLESSTIRRACHLFAQMVNTAQIKGFIHRNPARIATRSLPKVRPVNPAAKFPIDEHVEAIRQAGFPIAVALVDVFVEAGAEPGQIQRLLWSDCDFEAKCIKLRGTPSAEDPKGDILARFIDMTPRLIASLLRWKFISREKRTPHVFANRDGRPYYPSALASILDPAQVRAGLVSTPVPKSKRSAARALGKRGKGPQKPKPRRTHVRQAGLYSPSQFRLLAGARWVRMESLKVVQARLGQSVNSIQHTYRKILDERRTEDYLDSLPVYFGDQD